MAADMIYKMAAKMAKIGRKNVYWLYYTVGKVAPGRGI